VSAAEGKKGGARRTALIAAKDARLRVRAFDRLAALGYRVDAVGDLIAVDRRLAKDDYDLIVTDVLELPDVPEETRVVRVHPGIIDEGDAFERAVAGASNQAPEEPR
jgi:hypothetical protein